MNGASEQIRDFIIERIVDGTWPPAARLPARSDLCLQHGWHPAMLQQAMYVLAAEGFVVSRGRHGTFVADAPPVLRQVAVLCDAAPGARDWTGFYAALQHALPGLSGPLQFTLRSLPPVDSEQSGPALNLLADLQQRRLRGCLSLLDPAIYPQLLTALSAWPLVSVSGQTGLVAVPSLVIDDAMVAETGARLAAELGCRRLAVLSQARERCWRTDIDAALRCAGFADGAVAQLAVDPWSAATHADSVRLLAGCLLPSDGILVLQDNCLAGALQGWRALPVKERPRLLAHGNFPLLGAAPAEVARFGPDCAALLAQAQRWLQGSVATGARWTVPLRQCLPSADGRVS